MRPALLMLIACGAPAGPVSNAVSVPKSKIVPGIALEGIKLGASPVQLRTAFGEPSNIETYDDVTYWSYDERGLSYALQKDVVAWAIAYSGRIGGYEKGEFKRYPGTTPEGIGMDATEADVRRVYGAPTSAGDLSMAPVPSNWITYDARGLTFDFITATHQLITITVLEPASPSVAQPPATP